MKRGEKSGKLGATLGPTIERNQLWAVLFPNKRSGHATVTARDRQPQTIKKNILRRALHGMCFFVGYFDSLQICSLLDKGGKQISDFSPFDLLSLKLL